MAIGSPPPGKKSTLCNTVMIGPLCMVSTESTVRRGAFTLKIRQKFGALRHIFQESPGEITELSGMSHLRAKAVKNRSVS
ncbi:hypothetical protein VRC02_11820 [Erwinia sp. E_sp_B01_3]|uniref:hypothetical protein n=1 Tax=Erwinia sp. E_sp_B01_3 TaxID=3039402 RepID=UPI0030D0FB43